MVMLTEMGNSPFASVIVEPAAWVSKVIVLLSLARVAWLTAQRYA
jgi:hypothetical protein